jgi:hypothetical protein
MEKELKSCIGVLLRADITDSQFGQSANFCHKGWDGRALLGQPSKGTHAGFQFFFHNVLLHFYHQIAKNWRSILPCYILGHLHSV